MVSPLVCFTMFIVAASTASMDPCGDGNSSCSSAIDATKADGMLQQKGEKSRVFASGGIAEMLEDCIAWECTCQGLSNVYGLQHGVAGSATFDAMKWWIQHKCTTRTLPSASLLTTNGTLTESTGTTGDDSKCTSPGNDCCACDKSLGQTDCWWSEAATCSDGYIPVNKPGEYCMYTCFPPTASISDDSKCTSPGNDCCACDKSIGQTDCWWSEPATCRDGYIPVNKPGEMCFYTCHPPIAAPCLSKQEDDMCSVDPRAQVWDGPFPTDIAGSAFSKSYEVDSDACQQKCQEKSQCKAIKYTNRVQEFQSGKNCFLYDDQTDADSCACSSSQFWKRHGAPAPQVQCMFWGDPHFTRAFGANDRFDFQGIGLYELARSKDGNVKVQDFQCSWNHAATLSVAIGVAVHMDGHTTFIGPDISETSVESSDRTTKLVVKKQGETASPGYYLDMTLSMDKAIAADQGLCGMSDPMQATPVACTGESLFTQAQIAAMCELCTSPKPAHCDPYSCASNHIPLPESSATKTIQDVEANCGAKKVPAQEKCCWLDDDFAYKACLTDVCAADADTDKDVLAEDAVETVMGARRTCQQKDYVLECLPPRSSRCIAMNLWR